MFRWNTGMYMDRKVQKKTGRYRKILEKGKLVRECYCITLPINTANCMEIYSLREFWFQHYREKEIEIIGIATSRESAQMLLCDMVRDIFEEYGEVNAKSVAAFFDNFEKNNV